jgi:hypothetical protein
MGEVLFMESEQWFKDRKIGERLMVALGNVTPAALRTLQDNELDLVITQLLRSRARAGGSAASRGNARRGGSKGAARSMLSTAK